MLRFVLITLCFIAFGCRQKALPLAEFHQYIDDERNGLTSTIEKNGTKVSVTYVPTDHWVLQELDGIPRDPGTIDSMRQKYTNRLYFILSFSRNGEEVLTTRSAVSYSDLVQTMSFRMMDYVSLANEKNDEIPMGDFSINRTYGVGNSTDILVAYEGPRLLECEQLKLSIKEFGLGIDNVQFDFYTNDIMNSPNIDF